MVRILGFCKGSIAVLLREQAGVVVRDLDWLAFEEGVAKREEILDLYQLSVDGVKLVARSIEESREDSG